MEMWVAMETWVLYRKVGVISLVSCHIFAVLNMSGHGSWIPIQLIDPD